MYYLCWEVAAVDGLTDGYESIDIYPTKSQADAALQTTLNMLTMNTIALVSLLII